MENSQNTNEGLSLNHLKELEGVLSSLLTNQEIIIEQNKELLAAKKTERVWKIIKAILFILLVFGSIFYLPQMIDGIMNQVTSNLDMESIAGQNGLNLGVDQASELDKLLGN